MSKVSRTIVYAENGRCHAAVDLLPGTVLPVAGGKAPPRSDNAVEYDGEYYILFGPYNSLCWAPNNNAELYRDEELEVFRLQINRLVRAGHPITIAGEDYATTTD